MQEARLPGELGVGVLVDVPEVLADVVLVAGLGDVQAVRAAEPHVVEALLVTGVHRTLDAGGLVDQQHALLGPAGLVVLVDRVALADVGDHEPVEQQRALAAGDGGRAVRAAGVVRRAELERTAHLGRPGVDLDARDHALHLTVELVAAGGAPEVLVELVHGAAVPLAPLALDLDGRAVPFLLDVDREDVAALLAVGVVADLAVDEDMIEAVLAQGGHVAVLLVAADPAAGHRLAGAVRRMRGDEDEAARARGAQVGDRRSLVVEDLLPLGAAGAVVSGGRVLLHAAVDVTEVAVLIRHGCFSGFLSCGFTLRTWRGKDSGPRPGRKEARPISRTLRDRLKGAGPIPGSCTARTSRSR